jgi:decaprenyl-phosphate phosphoribosyltransferase
MKSYLKLMRIKHYIKNLLVFAPLFFAQSFLDPILLLRVFLGFVSFCLVSSIVYIINDIHDVEKDREHPIKKNRPIASGKVSKKQAWILAFLLFIISISLNLIWIDNQLALIILYGYLCLNLAYSFYLKRIPIVDVTVIVIGFILRIVYGGVLVSIQLSNWLILTVIAISYYLALGKRRNELNRNGNQSRDVLEHYNKEFLDKMMYVMLSLFIVFYSLWTVSISDNSQVFIWSIPLVILIVMKYSLIIENDSYGDPADVLFSDPVLLGLAGVYGVYMVSILYLF